MKKLYLFLILALSCLMANATDNGVVLGSPRSGAQNTNLLSIDMQANGRYCVYRYIQGDWRKQLFLLNSALFAIKIGSTTFSSAGRYSPTNPPSGTYLYGIPTAFTSIEDVGTAVTSGQHQTFTKRFNGAYSGNTFSVTVTINYDTTAPEYFTMTAVLNLSNIAAGTAVSFAYGFDTFVNTSDAGFAYILPDVNNLNNSSSQTNRYFTRAQVQALKIVGAKNNTGSGAVIGFFPIGRVFDRAYSSTPYSPGYCYNILGLTASSQNTNGFMFQFGPYSGGNDNGTGIGYDDLPAGQITEIRTGLTFTADIKGELDYVWVKNNVESKNVSANVGDQVSLRMKYSSYNISQLNNVGFRVDFPGLKQTGASNHTFISATTTNTANLEYYKLTSGRVAAYGSAVVNIPLVVDRAGLWMVDGNSLTEMTEAIPLGSPATLTVMTTAGLSSTADVNYCGGNQTFTVKFRDNETASQNVTLNLTYSGATADFSTRPASVTIPAGANSATFTVTSVASPTGSSPMTITVSGTDKVFATVNSANTVKVRAYPQLAAGTIAASQTLCSGETAAAFTSSAAASGGSGSYTYKWESSPDNSAWTVINGATSAAYAPTQSFTAQTYFRRSVTDAACSGTAYSNVISVSINPKPTVNRPASIVTEAGQTVAAINFAGTNLNAATSTWTGTRSDMGLAAAGTGNIAAFTARNYTMDALVDTITVRPRSAAGCWGDTVKFTITVYPKPELRRDSATVQEYMSVNIPVLNNDYLPSGAITPTFSLSGSVILSPKAGIVTPAGTGTGSNFVYQHKGYDPTTLQPVSLTNGIDSFEYRISGTGLYSGTFTLTAKVYVYVLQSANGGFAYCQSASTTTTLKSPAGATFYWYDTDGTTALAGNPTPAHTGAVPYTYYIEPRMTSGQYAGLSFPKGKLELAALGTASSPAKMRWTGHINHDWNNPANWVMANTGFESPASYPPALCTDVTISSSLNNYPELVDSAYCNNIRMTDRAMLKNPHVLRYSAASIDMKMKASELDRFVMLSAPLKDMYSGDYHYYNGSTLARGDVYMNYFQKKNPDYGSSVATAGNFTASFGTTHDPLPIGRAFNLKIQRNTLTRDSMMRFPARETVYDGQPLSRTNKNRFITDNISLSGGQFDMPINAAGESNSGFTVIQVTNPYMAYLRISDFLAGNSAVLNNGYYIWNGDVNSSFTAHAALDNGNRFVNTGLSSSMTAPGSQDLIPPLQSFFVSKLNTANVNTLKMSPSWTTTSSTAGGQYILRSEKLLSGGVMNIKASQGNKEAGAALVHAPETSGFVEKEDLPAVIYDENPLTVYTFSVTNVPLAINSSSVFNILPVPLGLRARDAGETKLEFGGLETFGYDVILVDKLLNKEISLKPNQPYTFSITKKSSATIVDNDRFQLKMAYTGKGLVYGTDSESINATAIRIVGDLKQINITADKYPLSSVFVYDLSGRLIYKATNLSESLHRVELDEAQIYVVKASAGSEIRIEKIAVK